MASIKTICALFLIVAAFIASSSMSVEARYTKRFDAMSGIDFVQVCLDNCAQCKRMFGPLFQGKSCAESCVNFDGKVIPDCEDLSSIAPFLNTVR